MPKEGYTTTALKKSTYWKLKELAARQQMHISDFLEKIVNEYQEKEI